MVSIVLIVLNVKALVGAFNQERALVRAFSVIEDGRYMTHNASELTLYLKFSVLVPGGHQLRQHGKVW